MEALSPRALRSRSEVETLALGRRLGEVLELGDVVALLGELGAGKTQFARGVAAGAQVPPEQVASPTFAIVYPYQGRLPLFHADLYRLRDHDEAYSAGLVGLELEGAVLLEWADRVPSALPKDHLAITFEVVSENERALSVEPRGERSERLVQRWLGT